MAHAKSTMFLNLTPDRVKAIRDRWYAFVEERKANLGRDIGTARLMVKNFVRKLGMFGATHGWAKTFASLNPDYGRMHVDQIIDRVFSTSNPTDLKTVLETMKNMYASSLQYPDVKKDFREVCNAFGFDYDGKDVVLPDNR